MQANSEAIDSLCGVQVSIISSQWLKDHNWTQYASPNSTAITVFGGEEVRSEGSLALQVVTTNGTIHHEFLVVSDKKNHLIFGLDAMAKLGIGLIQVPITYPKGLGV